MSTKMLFDSAQLLGQHGQKALLTAQNIWWQTQSDVFVGDLSVEGGLVVICLC